ncbi:MAG: polysaccharide biosynthesis C-terminal domain-containing protein, partial [Clostridiales bacterium]|nr:polysaccharide biosynthesis C-terminal domain-containing protein [Clostridiales bacterium]
MKGDFTQGKMWRNILAQAVPLTVAQLVQVLYNIVDRIYIGHLPEGGELALTGIGISAPIVTLISAFTLLFGQGGAPLCAIAEGAGNQERAQRIFGNTLSLLLGTSAVVLAVCLVFERQILFLFGASEETYAYAHQYFSVYILGTVCVMFSTGMNGFINLQGYPRVGMLTTVLGAVINLVLDPLFIFGLNLGITGAATATVLAQTVSALWVLQFFLSKKSRLRIRRADLAVQPKLAGEITALGLTGFMMSATNSLVQIVCNQMLGAYGGDLYISDMTGVISGPELLTLPGQGLPSGA